MTEETQLCKLCLEPISQSVCTNCLFTDVRRWVDKSRYQDMMRQIVARHGNIESLVKTYSDTQCVKCNNGAGQLACPCCYLFEMYELIKEANGNLAKDFEKSFGLDLGLHHAYSQLTLSKSLHDEPLDDKTFTRMLSERKNFSSTGICEHCGQVADVIEESNEPCMCGACRQESKIEIFRPFSIDFQ